MKDFYFNYEGKQILGSDYIKNVRKTSQATSSLIQMLHYPDTSMETNLLAAILKSHLYTLSVFKTYLKLRQDSEYEKFHADNFLMNNLNPDVFLCD